MSYLIDLIPYLNGNSQYDSDVDLDIPDPNENDLDVNDPDENGPENNGPNDNDPDDNGPNDNDPDDNGPHDDGSGPGGDGTDPDGDDSDPEGNDPNKNSKPLDKGKGKAKAITPELTSEEIQEPDTDSEEKSFQNDLEKARLNSLKERTEGESLKKGESSKEGATLEQREYMETQPEINTGLAEYYKAFENHQKSVRAFNDIVEKLHEKDSNMSEADREHLLNESIKVRNAVSHYKSYFEQLKSELNINTPEEEYSSEDNNSAEFSSEYSSDEEPRPSKRPRN